MEALDLRRIQGTSGTRKAVCLQLLHIYIIKNLTVFCKNQQNCTSSTNKYRTRHFHDTQLCSWRTVSLTNKHNHIKEHYEPGSYMLATTVHKHHRNLSTMYRSTEPVPWSTLSLTKNNTYWKLLYIMSQAYWYFGEGKKSSSSFGFSSPSFNSNTLLADLIPDLSLMLGSGEVRLSPAGDFDP